MRRARKKPVRVNAYRLGEQSEGLDRLIKEGLVSQSDDGTFEVHTMETKDEKGETAHAGDYVKLDAAGRPYPNKAEFFEKNHRHIDGDQYEQLLKESDYRNYAVQCFHRTERCVVYSRRRFSVADMTEDGIDVSNKDGLVDDEKFVDAENYIADIAVTADDKYVIMEVRDYDSSFLKVWDVEAGKWKKIDGKQEYPMGAWNGFVLGKESPVLAAYTTDGTIDILDLETGTCKQSLASGYYKTVQCAFMNQDQYLLSYGDDQYLTMWDVESGKVRMGDDSGDASGNLVTDGNSNYFGLMYRGYRWSDGDYKDSSLRVYSVDDDGQFYAYADVPSGYASFEGNEIFVVWLVGENGYYAPLYDYRELKKRAEDVLDGATLTDAEKKQYFVSE